MSKESQFTYIVFLRYFDEESKEYVGIKKEFNNNPDNPILDRETAFKFRDEIILGLLELLPIKGLNFKELSEIKKRDILCQFYFKNKKTEEWGENFERTKKEGGYFYSNGIRKPFKLKDDSISFYPLSFEGIWIQMKHNDKRYFDPFSEGEDRNTLVIDKIINKYDDCKYPPPLVEHLENELGFYEAHNYSTIGNKGQYKADISFFDDEAFEEDGDWDQPKSHAILRTPFDWTGYNKAFWWGTPSSQNDWKYLEWIQENKKQGKKNKEWNEKMPAIKDVIATEGENQYKEFKPALHYNVNTKKGSLGQMYRNAKAICAFLNSSGGYLLIGINDDGTIKGLESDFGLVTIHGREGQDPEEYFINKFTELMTKFFDKSVHPLVRGLLKKNKKDEYDISQTYFVIAVAQSPNPVFLKKQIFDKETKESVVIKEFFYRYNASSQSIQDPESILNYCKNKWRWY